MEPGGCVVNPKLPSAHTCHAVHGSTPVIIPVEQATHKVALWAGDLMCGCATGSAAEGAVEKKEKWNRGRRPYLQELAEADERLL